MTSPQQETLIETALRYAEYGLAVLPCDGKLPTLTKHGFKDATTDAAVIRAWLTHYPQANIGIFPGSARLLVVDIDVKGEADGFDGLAILEEEHGKLPETRSALTPSGGEHRYFKVPTEHTFGNRQPIAGIDIRCDAGYVVAPPSTVKGKPYRWAKRIPFAPLPPTWVELLRDKPYVVTRGNTQPGISSTRPGGSFPQGERARKAYIKAAYDRELDDLLNAPEGDGNNAVCRYAFNLGTLVHVGLREDDIRNGAEWVFQQWTWRNPGDLKSARRTLDGGIEAGKANPRQGVAS